MSSVHGCTEELESEKKVIEADRCLEIKHTSRDTGNQTERLFLLVVFGEKSACRSLNER